MRGRANRVGWTVVSVVFVVVGAGGLALSQGAFGSRRQHTAILSPALVRHWNQGGDTSFAIAGGVAAAAVLIGAVLALFQLRRPRPRRARLADLRYRARTGRGRTIVRVSGVRRALEVDLGRIEGVERAAVGLVDQDPAIHVDALLEVDGDHPLPTVAGAVSEAVGRTSHTVGRPVAETTALVRLTSRPKRPTRRVLE